MAASTSGAIKAYVEGLGLGVPVFQDEKPKGQALDDYVTVSQDISTVPDGVFNVYDDPNGHVTELAQVDLWEKWRTVSADSGPVRSSFSLPDALMKALNGCKLPAAPKHVVGVQVIDRVRLLERENNIVHHALTVQVRRVLV